MSSVHQNPVTWKVYVGQTRGRNGPVGLTLLGEFDTKREAARAAEGSRGGKYAPIYRKGHTYTVVPKRE